MRAPPEIDEILPPNPRDDFDAPPALPSHPFQALLLEVTWDRVDGASGSLGMEPFRLPAEPTQAVVRAFATALEADACFLVYGTARHTSAGLHTLAVRVAIVGNEHGEREPEACFELRDTRDGFVRFHVEGRIAAVEELRQHVPEVMALHADLALRAVLAGLESGEILPTPEPEPENKEEHAT